MANKNEKASAAQDAAVLNSSESFLLKNQKVIIACVIAIIVIVAGVSLYKTYYSGPRAGTGGLLRTAANLRIPSC